MGGGRDAPSALVGLAPLRKKIIPARGPRRDLWVVVVTRSQLRSAGRRMEGAVSCQAW